MYRMNAGSIYDNRRFNDCANWQIGSLHYVGDIRGKMIMIARTCHAFYHFQCAFRVGVEQGVDGRVSVCHIVQTVETKVADLSKQVPIVKTNVVFLPWLGDGVAQPWKIFT